MEEIKTFVFATVAALIGGSLISSGITGIQNAAQNVQDPVAKAILGVSGAVLAAGFLYSIAKMFLGV